MKLDLRGLGLDDRKKLITFYLKHNERFKAQGYKNLFTYLQKNKQDFKLIRTTLNEFFKKALEEDEEDEDEDEEFFIPDIPYIPNDGDYILYR